MEYRFADVAAFLTGIGGDFEGGKYTVKNDPGVYQVQYILDEAGEFVAPGSALAKGQTLYHLSERTVNATYATIPLILKLSTNEYGGFRYFGMFGGELGVRLKLTGDDTYYSSVVMDTVLTVLPASTQEDINLSEEAGALPLRLGMNAGAGAEYRLGGSTSVFFSVNFFRSFTNLLEKDSDFAYYKVEAGGYKFVRNSLKSTGIRINLGIMF
jgi:hypothetical protein